VADRKALLCWQVISLLKYDGYFLLIFTEKRLRNQSVTARLKFLQKNIENAGFDEKFKAISELVKNISVNKNVFEGKETPIVTITYRFNDPESICPIHTVEENHTPARADIMEIPLNLAHVRPCW
jgi:hypothetical protein